MNVETVARPPGYGSLAVRSVRAGHGICAGDRGRRDETEKVSEAVARLSTSAANIGEVVQLISAIAGQTNLLAPQRDHRGRRGPGKPGADLPSWPRKSRTSPRRPRKRRSRSKGKISRMQADTSNVVSAISSISDVIGNLKRDASSIAHAVSETARRHPGNRSQHDPSAQGTRDVATNIIVVSDASRQSGDECSARPHLGTGTVRRSRPPQACGVGIRCACAGGLMHAASARLGLGYDARLVAAV